MQKILPITRVIMRRVHWIFKIRRGRRKWLLRMVLKLTPKRATTTLKNDHSQETESRSLETSTTFHSENPCEHCENSKVYGTLIMKCPNCFRHDYYKICQICDHQIPEERNYIKEGFLRCHDCRAITHKKAKTLETNFYFLCKEENEEED